ncbi:hypothetical protein FISHEDRAFT_53741 [Fistulina hepatica ATCC 64428]|uniref:DUF218 domain-containing protein n=1 Tax=Fistulina hepatica ATCC 64428 TaxID=1128425 RepID=A0A0D6ZZM7_9AGAR|nr:hypothetical protein FISHEDRAFT_53741 [Fistulina hepatica ATCC 64428]
MLPTPVVGGVKRVRPFRRSSRENARKQLSDFLFTRARFNNFAFILLASFAILSFVLNLQLCLFAAPRQLMHAPNSILATILHTDTLSALSHLIIVPGHAIWRGIDPELRLDESEWYLEPYQKGGDRVAVFFEHMSKGAQLALDDPHSLLVFSGQTHLGSTMTEAESYLRLALHANLFKTPASLYPFRRATTETQALDSYQNLLFSIARFYEYTGRYPEKITVVGYEMKRARFFDLHRAAIRWPAEKFTYIGIDPKGEDDPKGEEREKTNGYLPYSQDLYGCHGYLQSKRLQRNPFARFHSYYTSSPELSSLLDWCPDSSSGTRLFDGRLPWD